MPALIRLRFLLVMLAFVVACGTLGYVRIERYPVLDAVYMTVITLTTVGFSETHPLSPSGRLFTIGLIAVGLSVVYGVLASALEIMFGEQLRDVFGRQRMERRLHDLKDHSIVCGYGRMGQEIVREFRARGVPFVVIERDAAEAAPLAE